MIKKFISITAMLLAVFCMNIGAQELQSCKLDSHRAIPKTSKITLNDTEFWWGYYNGSFDKAQMIGVGDKTKIPQSYSAATCILAGTKELEGRTISGVSFSFPSCKNISDVKIWISQSLPSAPENASHTCEDVTEKLVGYNVEGDQFNEIRFKKPFKIDSSKGVYVGYSFVVTLDEGQFDKFPIFTSGEELTHTRALMVKCGDAPWKDYMQYGFGDLALRFLISGGTFDSDKVNVNETFPEITTLKGSEINIPVEVENKGGNGFTSLGIEVDVAGEKQELTVTPEEKVSGIGVKYNFDIALKVPDKYETLPVKVTIKEVNGAANNSTENVMKGNVTVLSRKVDRKVLFEEFTATWCGFCPRGAVGLAKAKQVYGDKIVPMAIHYQDEMDAPGYFNFIKNTVSGFPGGHIDRKYMGVDPYFGTTNGVKFAVADLIDDCLADTPKAEVTADAVIDGDILTARAEYKFLYTGNANCAIAYVVTQDGIKNDDWWQGNNYSGAEGFEDEPLFDKYVNAGKKAKGIVYDEVVIVTKGVYKGLDDSVPQEVNAEELLTHEVTVDLSEYPLIMDRTKLNLCVFMLDRNTGRVVNADMKSLNPATGIDEVNAGNGEIEETSRFTIDGRRISASEKGINIVKYSDGSTKKVIVK